MGYFGGEYRRQLVAGDAQRGEAGHLEPPAKPIQQPDLTSRRGLDLLAIRGRASLVIIAPDREHLAWWTDNDESMLRLWTVCPLHTLTVIPTVKVMDETGARCHFPPICTVWQESFRYFRRSQITDNLCEAVVEPEGGRARPVGVVYEDHQLTLESARC